jgi:flagellin-like hook-associated protein FlgL
MVQTADGALCEVDSILQWMRELVVEAGGETLSAAERDVIGSELVSLRNEIDNTAGRTTLDGQSLLTGAFNISTASASGPINDGGDAATVNVRVVYAKETYNVTVVGSDATVTNAGNGEFQTITAADLNGDGSTAVLDFD